VGKRYQLLRVLGHGSYGEVAQALDKVTGDKVAIKRINNVFDQEIDTKRILREVYILRRLKNPHVINLINVVTPE
jgi:mitogen-activated protein kinase 1/3